MLKDFFDWAKANRDADEADLRGGLGEAATDTGDVARFSNKVGVPAGSPPVAGAGTPDKMDQKPVLVGTDGKKKGKGKKKADCPPGVRSMRKDIPDLA